MDPTIIVEDTERTQFCPQTEGQTDRQTDDVKPVYPPFNFVKARGDNDDLIFVNKLRRLKLLHVHIIPLQRFWYQRFCEQFVMCLKVNDWADFTEDMINSYRDVKMFV